MSELDGPWKYEQIMDGYVVHRGMDAPGAIVVMLEAAAGALVKTLNALEAELQEAKADAARLAGELANNCQSCADGYPYEVDEEDPNSAWHPITDRMCNLNMGEREALENHARQVEVPT